MRSDTTVPSGAADGSSPALLSDVCCVLCGVLSGLPSPTRSVPPKARRKSKSKASDGGADGVASAAEECKASDDADDGAVGVAPVRITLSACSDVMGALDGLDLERRSALQRLRQALRVRHEALRDDVTAVYFSAARGAGKSTAINQYAVDYKSLRAAGHEELWGHVPLLSGSGGSTVTQIPSDLLWCPAGQADFIVQWSDHTQHSIFKEARQLWHQQQTRDHAIAPPSRPTPQWVETLKIMLFASMHAQNICSNMRQQGTAAAAASAAAASSASAMQHDASLSGDRPRIVKFIQRNDWAFGPTYTMHDTLGWEPSDSLSLLSDASLRSADVVVSVSGRAMLVDELKSLFSHGAFADPRKPAVLLNLYHTADRAAGFAVMSSEALAAAAAASAAVSSSALGDPSSSVLNSIHSAIKKLSKDESVLPQVPNWDARSRIFTALRDNMVACPLLSDPEIKQHKLMTALLTSRTNRMRQRFIDFIKEASSVAFWCKRGLLGDGVSVTRLPQFRPANLKPKRKQWFEYWIAALKTKIGDALADFDAELWGEDRAREGAPSKDGRGAQAQAAAPASASSSAAAAAPSGVSLSPGLSAQLSQLPLVRQQWQLQVLSRLLASELRLARHVFYAQAVQTLVQRWVNAALDRTNGPQAAAEQGAHKEGLQAPLAAAAHAVAASNSNASTASQSSHMSVPKQTKHKKGAAAAAAAASSLAPTPLSPSGSKVESVAQTELREEYTTFLDTQLDREEVTSQVDLKEAQLKAQLDALPLASILRSCLADAQRDCSSIFESSDDESWDPDDRLKSALVDRLMAQLTERCFSKWQDDLFALAGVHCTQLSKTVIEIDNHPQLKPDVVPADTRAVCTNLVKKLTKLLADEKKASPHTDLSAGGTAADPVRLHCIPSASAVYADLRKMLVESAPTAGSIERAMAPDFAAHTNSFNVQFKIHAMEATATTAAAPHAAASSSAAGSAAGSAAAKLQRIVCSFDVPADKKSAPVVTCQLSSSLQAVIHAYRSRVCDGHFGSLKPDQVDPLERSLFPVLTPLLLGCEQEAYRQLDHADYGGMNHLTFFLVRAGIQQQWMETAMRERPDRISRIVLVVVPASSVPPSVDLDLLRSLVLSLGFDYAWRRTMNVRDLKELHPISFAARSCATEFAMISLQYSIMDLFEYAKECVRKIMSTELNAKINWKLARMRPDLAEDECIRFFQTVEALKAGAMAGSKSQASAAAAASHRPPVTEMQVREFASILRSLNAPQDAPFTPLLQSLEPYFMLSSVAFFPKRYLVHSSLPLFPHVHQLFLGSERSHSLTLDHLPAMAEAPFTPAEALRPSIRALKTAESVLAGQAANLAAVSMAATAAAAEMPSKDKQAAYIWSTLDCEQRMQKRLSSKKSDARAPQLLCASFGVGLQVYTSKERKAKKSNKHEARGASSGSQAHTTNEQAAAAAAASVPDHARKSNSAPRKRKGKASSDAAASSTATSSSAAAAAAAAAADPNGLQAMDTEDEGPRVKAEATTEEGAGKQKKHKNKH